MKLMFASDIHGSLYYCEKMAQAFEKEAPERLILLGDLLYHGPRNDLPRDYNPKDVIPILNGLKEHILAVRGNCDAEVDQMVLEFPITADFFTLFDRRHMFFITHGHLYNEEKLPLLNKGDVFIHGHTHVSVAANRGDYYFLNPGSTSIPKDGNAGSYMIYKDGTFTIKDFDGNVLKSLNI